MPDLKPEVCRGVKTFFVNPDLSLMPELFREDFFKGGYETYYLFDDFTCPLEKKIHILFSLFPELILFFNIDRRIPDIGSWDSFIGKIQSMYKDRAIIGVLYARQQNAQLSREYEKTYLYDIGIQGGCIALEYQKNKNFMILSSVLLANQANGQRKSIRMMCDENYKMCFQYNGIELRAPLSDLSVSHFSCSTEDELSNIQLHTLIPDILFNFHGVICKSSAVLILRRVINGKTVNVFVFRTHDGRDGLESDVKSKIINLIYTRTVSDIENLLRQIFSLVKKQQKQQIQTVVTEAVSGI